jgi:hypothetical protein
MPCIRTKTDLEKQLVNLIEAGVTNRLELAGICGVSVSTIQKHLPSDLKRKGAYTTGPCGQLTDREQQVIEGGLLGDGSMVQHARGSAFRFANSHTDLVEWIAGELRALVNCDENHRYFQSRPFNEKQGMATFRTATWNNLNALHDRWYGPDTGSGFRKRIPVDLVLTPLSALLWYLGDGSLTQDLNGKTSQVLTLATHAFAFKSLQRTLKPQLVEILSCRKHDIALEPDRRVRGYPRCGYQIRIPARYVPRWLRFIGSCPVLSYSYKWNVRPRIRRLWLENEIEFLRRCWGRIPHRLICDALSVSYEQARTVAQRRLGIHRGYSNSGKSVRGSGAMDFQQLLADLRSR